MRKATTHNSNSKRVGRMIVMLIVLCSCVLLPSAHSMAYYDPPINGDGWSISVDLVLTLESDRGWRNFLNSMSGIHEFNCLILKKDVTEFQLYSDFYPLEETLSFVKEGIYAPRFITQKIVLEEGNPVFYLQNGMLVNRKTKELVVAEATITEASIPEGVESIGIYAFLWHEQLTTLRMPDSVKTIKESAFFSCSSLKEIRFSSNLKYIGKDAFAFCGIQSIQFPDIDPAPEFDWGVMRDCKELKTVDLSNLKLKEIPKSMFSGCESLETVILPAEVTAIRGGAFGGCHALKSIDLPQGVETIEGGAFGNCNSFDEFVLPQSVHTISGAAFTGCRFQLIRFPSGISITGRAEMRPWAKFAYCFDSMQTVVFEGDFTLGDYAIEDIDQLIALGAPPKSVTEVSFGKYARKGTAYFLDEYAEAWAPNGETTWNGFALRQITRAEAEAMIAEAAQPTPTPSPTPTPKATLGPWPTLSPTSTPKLAAAQAREGGDWVAYLLIGGIVIVAAGVVVLALAGRKKR